MIRGFPVVVDGECVEGANSRKFLPLQYSPVIESPCNAKSRDQVYMNALGSPKEADHTLCDQQTLWEPQAS